MESNFVRADNSNLPKIDAFMVALFFKNNADYYAVELKNVKTAVEVPRRNYLFTNLYVWSFINFVKSHFRLCR